MTRPLVDGQPGLAPDDTASRRCKSAIGREHEDEIDTQVHLTLRAAARPLPRRTIATGAPHTPGAPTSEARPSTRARRCGVGRRRLARGGAGRGIARAAHARRRSTCSRSRAASRPGLARPDLYNWYTRFSAGDRCESPAARCPSCPSARTTRTTTSPGYPAAAGRPLGSPTWIAEYRRRVEGVTREFTRPGSRRCGSAFRFRPAGLPAASPSSTRSSSPLPKHAPRLAVRGHVAPARQRPRQVHGIPARRRQADADAGPTECITRTPRAI